MEISPYSLSHEWSLHWTRIPSNIKRSPLVNGESPKERRALEALAAVGLIGGTQLTRIFSLDKKRLKRMVAERKLVRHEIHRNKQIVPIYTLGINGAVIAGLGEFYESNYWFEYEVEDALKRILFFQLFQHFPEAKVIPSQKPFSGVIQFQDKLFYVYVIRGDVSDLPMYLKWDGKNFNERVIIITESIRHLQLINETAKNLRLRVSIDNDLQIHNVNLYKLFYFFDEVGAFKRESENKEIVY
ncbi:hypothetical protein [Saccharococcus sp. Marseille-Q5394]|uniref:hypothetical protein n=1 Tax=Saccharococcus sp. Marseille-Q5394 TaxID=2972778 RepID=UPI0021C92EB6|nr:hypothetical protein [Saccharococcus sp. Marseille-Q5394]